MRSRRDVIATLGGVAAALSCRRSWADEFPSRPVTFVVPFPPGGGIDVVLRAMAPRLQERLGKPVLIENRAGGGGNVAAAAVAKSPPDGHMLFAAPSTLAANATLYKSLPFDTLKDFQAVSLVLRTPYFLVVHASVPARTVSELVTLLREKPGEISYAHSGPGSSLHLTAELFQAMTGTRMNGVGYRGAPPAFSDVLAGHVSVMFVDTGTALAQINQPGIRVLAVSSSTRIPAAPEIPTLAEAGVAGFEAVGWLLVCAPSATPSSIIERLASEIRASAAPPDIRELMIKLGTVPVDSRPPAELQTFLAGEIKRWGDVIERAGVAASQ
ncbi:MAG: Bug family tripartite tricarboxylate transporter substrate binding protein [Xanthobacteraceae bacterium]